VLHGLAPAEAFPYIGSRVDDAAVTHIDDLAVVGAIGVADIALGHAARPDDEPVAGAG